VAPDVTAATDTDPPVSDWPAYQFILLDLAVACGDFQAAAEAQRRLERLGISVFYRHAPRRRTRRREGGYDAR
jgi:hypothetical protein